MDRRMSNSDEESDDLKDFGREKDFNEYMMEFSRKAYVIKDRIKQLSTLKGEKQKTYAAETERQIEDLRDNIHKQQDSLQNIDDKADYNRLLVRHKNAKNDYNKIVGDFNRVMLVQTDADYSSDDMAVQDVETRKLLLKGAEKADDGLARLYNAIRIADTTEGIGTGALSEMNMQKQQLKNVNAQLTEIDEHVSTGKKILNVMERRIITNKFVLAFIILVELLAIFLIVYFKWIKK